MNSLMSHHAEHADRIFNSRDLHPNQTRVFRDTPEMAGMAIGLNLKISLQKLITVNLMHPLRAQSLVSLADHQRHAEHAVITDDCARLIGRDHEQRAIINMLVRTVRHP